MGRLRGDRYVGGHLVPRLRLGRRPLVTVTPPPAEVVVERDVEVVVRDGTTLRVNVFRPAVDDGPRPVLLSAHPYGKDATLPPRRGDGSFGPPRQFRLLPQTVPFTLSALTSWEAPDPAFWVPRGYVVVNADLRGWGHSDGVGQLLSEQEGRDVADLVEWAGTQPWSTGRVGMNGVSYLAITQWAAAAERPAHLAAICPWEGFTDAYRDFLRPGGVAERGFVRLFTAGLAAQRRSKVGIIGQQRRRELYDQWWAARDRDLERIDVPALVCASFSDHNLHSRGSFEGFRRMGSTRKWLYTHRGPKWATYYGADALAHQLKFFDHVLKDADNGMDREPRVRVEVREDASTVVDVRGEDDWPPPGTRWEPLHLAAAGYLAPEEPPLAGEVSFDVRRGRASFTYRFEEDTDLVGPMWLRLWVEARGADDLLLFAGVRKLRRAGPSRSTGSSRSTGIVGFQGSYGFDRALVSQGMLAASHRSIDPDRSLPWSPFHPHDRRQPLQAGQVVACDIELGAQATRFRAGDGLRLDVAGRWFFPRNPLTGQFPAGYARNRRGTCVLHCGGLHDAALHIPRR